MYSDIPAYIQDGSLTSYMQARPIYGTDWSKSNWYEQIRYVGDQLIHQVAYNWGHISYSPKIKKYKRDVSLEDEVSIYVPEERRWYPARPMQKIAVLLFFKDFSDDFYGFHNIEHMCLSWWDDPTYILITDRSSRKLACIHEPNIVLKDPFAKYSGSTISLTDTAIVVDGHAISEVKYTVRPYDRWYSRMTHNHEYYIVQPNPTGNHIVPSSGLCDLLRYYHEYGYDGHLQVGQTFQNPNIVILQIQQTFDYRYDFSTNKEWLTRIIIPWKHEKATTEEFGRIPPAVDWRDYFPPTIGDLSDYTYRKFLGIPILMHKNTYDIMSTEKLVHEEFLAYVGIVLPKQGYPYTFLVSR